MFEKIRKMKNKKGFTLVELIVVLVILAILAALLVPALTGYIDKANNQKVVATTRSIVVAAQTEVSEKYGVVSTTNGKLTNASTTISKSGEAAATGEVAADKVTMADILKLAEVTDSAGKFKNGVSKVEITYSDEGHITKVYVEQSGRKCTYNEGAAEAYTVS